MVEHCDLHICQKSYYEVTRLCLYNLFSVCAIAPDVSLKTAGKGEKQKC